MEKDYEVLRFSPRSLRFCGDTLPQKRYAPIGPGGITQHTVKYRTVGRNPHPTNPTLGGRFACEPCLDGTRSPGHPGAWKGNVASGEQSPSL